MCVLFELWNANKEVLLHGKAKTFFLKFWWSNYDFLKFLSFAFVLNLNGKMWVTVGFPFLHSCCLFWGEEKRKNEKFFFLIFLLYILGMASSWTEIYLRFDARIQEAVDERKKWWTKHYANHYLTKLNKIGGGLNSGRRQAVLLNTSKAKDIWFRRYPIQHWYWCTTAVLLFRGILKSFLSKPTLT